MKWKLSIENNIDSGMDYANYDYSRWNTLVNKMLQDNILQFEVVLRQSVITFATEIQKMGFRYDVNVYFNVFYSQMTTIVTSIIKIMGIAVDDTDFLGNISDMFTNYTFCFRDQHLLYLSRLITTDKHSQLKDVEKALIEMTDFYRESTVCFLKEIWIKNKVLQ